MKALGKKVEEEGRNLENENEKLEAYLENVKTLNGLVPICASCKRIRDDHGHWHHGEEYNRTHPNAKFSHGICPECFKKMYPKFEEMKKKIDPDEKSHDRSN